MFEEVLSDTFSVFFKNVRSFLILVLVIALPLLIVQVTVSSSITGASLSSQVEVMKSFKDLGNPSTIDKLSKLNQPQQNMSTSDWIFYYAIIVVIGLFMNIINIGAVLVCNDYFQGVPFTLGSVLSRAVRKLPGIIGISLIMGLATLVGFVLLIIPGIILLVKFSLSLPIYVLEDTSIFHAISQSFKLTKGKGWAILFNVLIFGILVLIVSFACGMLGLIGFVIPTIATLLT
ncbi:MAG: glycerophosphoryl diester phosphodiesterase membrane domain-containing protein, partial [Ignavibacteriales bacterium]